MRWFLNMTTRAKLVAGFGLMVIFLAIVVATAYTSISAIQESQRQLYAGAFTYAIALKDLRSNQNAVRANVLAMLLAARRTEHESWLDDISKREKEADATMARLLEANRGDAQLFRRLEELNAIREIYKGTRNREVIPLILEGKTEEARKLAFGVQAERDAKMKAAVDQLIDDADKRARSEIEESEAQAAASARIFAVAGVLALAVGIGMVWILARTMADPLVEIAGFADRVAAGDLTVAPAHTGRTDEVGVLSQMFARMVGSLREVTRQIREGTGVLGSAAAEILATTTQVASGAAETATAISETTTTVEEVKQTAEVSSQKARYVSESAQRSAQVSQAGRKSVEQTVAAMNRIREQMESIAQSIVRLSEQGQAIGEIIATVNDLADQSNLLAVNAAIEAAKAGEHGKGFAVVAQEIRSLAEQSKQATAQVRSILTDIQKATSAAVLATEQGTKAVDAGVRQSAEAGESIRALAESIGESAQAATQIAASSQQQLVGMDQVASAMESIRQASAQNVAGTKQAESAAQNLHELGQKLKQLVERYRV